MNKTIKTTIHSYSFNTKNPDEARAYDELAARLKGQGLKCFRTHGGGSHHMPDLDGQVIELETAFLFGNQWNTGEPHNLRVFDWAEDAIFHNGVEARHIKRGHYLDQTEEMTTLRAVTGQCGYCGAYGEPGTIHRGCLESPYLKAEELHLLRMLPVRDSFGGERAPLTEAEAAELLPLYRSAQLHGTTERGKAQRAKVRADITKKRDKALHNATTEHDGMLWLLDHEMRTDNVIFYDHTGMFCIGWRTPLDEGAAGDWLDVLCEFPYAYELKRADAPSLSTRASR